MPPESKFRNRVMIISINFINLRTINDLKMTTANKNLKNEQS